MRQARVVFVYQHFWPDSPPYASMLRVIGGGLASDGFAVRMLTGQPSYKATDRRETRPARETVDGVDVRRLPSLPGASRFAPLRALGKLLFPPRALLALLASGLTSRRPDIVVAATIPPVLNGLCALAGARLVGARFVYHLQDVYPEIGAVAGLWPETSIRHRLMYAVDRFVTRRADCCLVLSEDMRDSLSRRGVRDERLVVVNNFMLEPVGDARGHASAPSGFAPDLDPVRRHVVFAGNLGRFQALEELLGAFLAHARVSDAFELHFLGDGVARERLVAIAGRSDRVRFHGHVDLAAATAFVSRCDAGIVSVGEGVHRYAYPSKTLTYLGLGVPVLALVEEHAALARDVREHRLGVTSADRSPEGLVEAFSALESWLESHPTARRDVLEYAAANASPAVVLERWRTLLHRLRGARNVDLVR